MVMSDHPYKATISIEARLVDHGGNIEIRRGKSGERLYGKVSGPDPERRMFLSHLVTCEAIGSDE